MLEDNNIFNFFIYYKNTKYYKTQGKKACTQRFAGLRRTLDLGA